MGGDESSANLKKGQLYCIGSSIRSVPSHIKVYGKVTKPGGSSLAGVKTDLSTMYKWAIRNEVDYKGCIQLGSDLLTGEDKCGVLSKIKLFFKNSRNYKTTYLYYTGHGDGQGNWALETSNGVQLISPSEILKIWYALNPPQIWGASKLQIILDQCFAGKWCKVDLSKQIQPPPVTKFLMFRQEEYAYPSSLSLKYIIINASCQADQQSRDWGLEEGGAFTCIRYGGVTKGLHPEQRPSRMITQTTREYFIYSKIKEITSIKDKMKQWEEEAKLL